MSDLNSLEPLGNLGPGTIEERLTRKLASFKQRLDYLERTRPVPSAGAFAPSGTPLIGARHLDTSARRYWVWTGTSWVTPDADRALVEELGQVQTNSPTPVDLGGPSLTMYVPEPAVISLQVDVELMASNFGTNFTQAHVHLQQPDGPTQRVLREASVWGQWRRRLSHASRADQPSGGGVYPVGGFRVFSLGAPGAYTWTLRYSAPVLAGDQLDAFFRNRRIWAVML